MFLCASLQKDVTLLDDLSEGLACGVPLDDVDFEGEIGLAKGVAQIGQYGGGEGGFSYDRDIEIGGHLGGPGCARTKCPDFAVRHMGREDFPDGL